MLWTMSADLQGTWGKTGQDSCTTNKHTLKMMQCVLAYPSFICWESDVARKYRTALARQNIPTRPTTLFPSPPDMTSTSSQETRWSQGLRGGRDQVEPGSKVGGMAAGEVEDLASSLKGLSAAQLMEKKESIEKDIKEFDDVLQTVRRNSCAISCVHYLCLWY